jgi:hypothetical protein
MRWVKRGVLSRSGKRVKLSAVKMPGGWMTTQAFIDDFISALNVDESGNRPVHIAQERARRARARLAEKGFGNTCDRPLQDSETLHERTTS